MKRRQKDVYKRQERMWENVEALLKEAECTFDDLGHMIVYLRDIADYAVVKLSLIHIYDVTANADKNYKYSSVGRSSVKIYSADAQYKNKYVTARGKIGRAHV